MLFYFCTSYKKYHKSFFQKISKVRFSGMHASLIDVTQIYSLESERFVSVYY